MLPNAIRVSKLAATADIKAVIFGGVSFDVRIAAFEGHNLRDILFLHLFLGTIQVRRQFVFVFSFDF
jgi:hypothetical protein